MSHCPDAFFPKEGSLATDEAKEEAGSVKGQDLFAPFAPTRSSETVPPRASRSREPSRGESRRGRSEAGEGKPFPVPVFEKTATPPFPRGARPLAKPKAPSRECQRRAETVSRPTSPVVPGRSGRGKPAAGERSRSRPSRKTGLSSAGARNFGAAGSVRMGCLPRQGFFPLRSARAGSRFRSPRSGRGRDRREGGASSVPEARAASRAGVLFGGIPPPTSCRLDEGVPSFPGGFSGRMTTSRELDSSGNQPKTWSGGSSIFV
jgi:hypothetical protein